MLREAEFSTEVSYACRYDMSKGGHLRRTRGRVGIYRQSTELDDFFRANSSA